MGLKANSVQSGGFRQEPLESGNYLARVVQVIDLGLQAQNPYKGQEKPPVNMLNVTYELVSEFCLDEDGNELKDKPRWVSETLPLYPLTNDKAKCTKRIQGIDPSNDLEGDWSQTLGKSCTVTIVQNVSRTNGKVYANVGNVTPAMKGIEVPFLVNATKVFDLDDPDMDVFSSLPDWLQGKIKDNLEYKGSKLHAYSSGESPDSPTETETEFDSDDEMENPL